jgi:hypothetical protein
MWVYYALGGAAGRHFHRGVFAPEVFLGIVIVGGLCLWDPINRLLGPIVRPPLPRLIKAAMFLGIGCLSITGTFAGALWIPGDGNASLFALFVAGASGFMSLVAAYALTVVGLQDRRRRRQQAPDATPRRPNSR